MQQEIACNNSGARVLVAEDDRSTRSAIARHLSTRGYEVVAVADGVAALDAAVRRQPDIALIDLGLPALDGLQVVARLKATFGASVHTIVVSARSGEPARLSAFDAGADDFVGKPFSIPELICRVDAADRHHRAYVDARLATDKTERIRVYAAEAAALLAHDLNSGLAVALTNLSYVAARAGLQGEPEEALASSLYALQRLSGLVTNFADIHRMEDEVMKPRCSDVLVRRTFASVAMIHAHAAALRSGGATLHVRCSPQLKGRFDPTLIERVLHNLVGNALRYVNSGGDIWVSAMADSGDESTLVLEVANTGPSISTLAASSLFEKYRTTDEQSHRGMGLYFCRLVCEAHGGSIAFAPGDVTRFIVRLPGAHWCDPADSSPEAVPFGG